MPLVAVDCNCTGLVKQYPFHTGMATGNRIVSTIELKSMLIAVLIHSVCWVRFVCALTLSVLTEIVSPLFTDIRVKEQTVESYGRKKKEYEPPRFMSVAEAADQLLQILQKKRDAGISEEDLAYTEQSLFVGLARVGHDTQAIKGCTLKEMATADLGPPLHSLVLPARNLHHLELEYLQPFSSLPLQELTS